MIDVSKLTRDYTKEPLKKIGKNYETIPYEDFYELYINQNVSRDELCNFFGFSKRIFQKTLQDYDIKKENSNKKNANEITRDELYKYYVEDNHRFRETTEHFGISSDTLNKLCKKFGIDKSSMRNSNTKETMTNKYGVDNAFKMKK